MKRSQSVKPDIKSAIKAEAGKRILLVAPEWKQRNLIARAVELRDIMDDRWLTAADQGEKDAAAVVWGQIKAIRAHSDSLEADVDAGKAVDVGAGWPV